MTAVDAQGSTISLGAARGGLRSCLDCFDDRRGPDPEDGALLHFSGRRVSLIQELGQAAAGSYFASTEVDFSMCQRSCSLRDTEHSSSDPSGGLVIRRPSAVHEPGTRANTSSKISIR